MTHEHLDLAELSTLYQAQLEVISEMERKIARLQEIADVLFEIAPAGPVKSSLWKKYQNVVAPKKVPRKSPHEPLEGMSGI